MSCLLRASDHSPKTVNFAKFGDIITRENLDKFSVCRRWWKQDSVNLTKVGLQAKAEVQDTGSQNRDRFTFSL